MFRLDQQLDLGTGNDRDVAQGVSRNQIVRA